MSICNNIFINNFIITNIKISFVLQTSINNFKIKIKKNLYKKYYKKQNYILRGKFGVVTILGANYNHVNITGIRSIKQVSKSIKIFCETFEINLNAVQNAKIDCISTTSNAPSGLKFKILNLSANVKYEIINPPKFPGIIFKKYNSPTLIYFNSGKINLIGSKTISEIKINLLNFIEFLKKI